MASISAGVLLVTLCALFGLISAFEITHARNLNLPGGERISRRSAIEYDDETNAGEDTRHRRAANTLQQHAQSEDLETAANTVFLPHFHKRLRPAYQRFVRSAGEDDQQQEYEHNGRLVRRSAADGEAMDTAASTVFLPHFNRRVRPDFRRY